MVNYGGPIRGADHDPEKRGFNKLGGMMHEKILCREGGASCCYCCCFSSFFRGDTSGRCVVSGPRSLKNGA